MAELVDTHAHLYLEQFDADMEQTMLRAKANGVNCILLPNIDRSTTKRLWKTVNAFPETCFPMINILPRTFWCKSNNQLFTIIDSTAKSRS